MSVALPASAAVARPAPSQDVRCPTDYGSTDCARLLFKVRGNIISIVCPKCRREHRIIVLSGKNETRILFLDDHD